MSSPAPAPPAAVDDVAARVGAADAYAGGLPLALVKYRRTDAHAARLGHLNDDVALMQGDVDQLARDVGAAAAAAADRDLVAAYERRVSAWVSRLACLPCAVETFHDLELLAAVRPIAQWEVFKQTFALDAFYRLKDALGARAAAPGAKVSTTTRGVQGQNLLLALIRMQMRDADSVRDMFFAAAGIGVEDVVSSSS